MSYEAVAAVNDDLIIKSIYELLGIKPGDKVIWELKNGVVQFKKSQSNIPVSCRSLTEDELKHELLKGTAAAENGKTVSEEEVIARLKKLRSS